VRGRKRGRKRTIELGNPVENDENKEIDIGEPAELLEEVEREESDHGVLGGPDLVGLVLLGGIEVHVSIPDVNLPLLLDPVVGELVSPFPEKREETHFKAQKIVPQKGLKQRTGD